MRSEEKPKRVDVIEVITHEDATNDEPAWDEKVVRLNGEDSYSIIWGEDVVIHVAKSWGYPDVDVEITEKVHVHIARGAEEEKKMVTEMEKWYAEKRKHDKGEK
jgi:hypothetical protein